MVERADGDATGGGVTPVNELTYTAASRELDSIVEFFEQRDVDIDLLVSRLERATAIVDELDRRIRRTRAQVEELVPKLEGISQRTNTDALATADTEPDDDQWDEASGTEEIDGDRSDQSDQPLF
jgi:exonuclease VII small subunit